MLSLGRIKNFISDCLFPIFCLNCGVFIKAEERRYLCSNCFKNINIYSALFCPICLKRIGVLKKCYHSNKKSYLDFLGCATEYNNPLVKNLLHCFKYQFIKEIGLTLSDILIVYWTKIWPDVKARFSNCLVISIPLYHRRFNWRGFNQSEELARVFANYFRLPLVNNVLIRKKNTPPQVQVENFENRLNNIIGAFQIKNSSLIKNKKIILIDDVFTSGATLQEGAKILKENGAKEIIGLVIAK